MVKTKIAFLVSVNTNTNKKFSDVDELSNIFKSNFDVDFRNYTKSQICSSSIDQLKMASKNSDAIVLLLDKEDELYFFNLGFSAALSIFGKKPILFVCLDNNDHSFYDYCGLFFGIDELLKSNGIIDALIHYLRNDIAKFWISYSKYIIPQFNENLPTKLIALDDSVIEKNMKGYHPKNYSKKLLNYEVLKNSTQNYAMVSDIILAREMNPNSYLKLKSKEKNIMKIFISYSKHDNQHKDKLLKFLAPLRDNEKIATWHDRDIQAGEEWDERIKEELNAADIVLYLVSMDSLATAYIQKVELPLIEQRSQAKQCKLVPVIVDYCDWEESWVAKYNALPAKGVPITDGQWKNENQAWLEVIKGIKQIIVPT